MAISIVARSVYTTTPKTDQNRFISFFISSRLERVFIFFIIKTTICVMHWITYVVYTVYTDTHVYQFRHYFTYFSYNRRYEDIIKEFLLFLLKYMFHINIFLMYVLIVFSARVYQLENFLYICCMEFLKFNNFSK